MTKPAQSVMPSSPIFLHQNSSWAKCFCETSTLELISFWQSDKDFPLLFHASLFFAGICTIILLWSQDHPQTTKCCNNCNPHYFWINKMRGWLTFSTLRSKMILIIFWDIMGSAEVCQKESHQVIRNGFVALLTLHIRYRHRTKWNGNSIIYSKYLSHILGPTMNIF